MSSVKSKTDLPIDPLSEPDPSIKQTAQLLDVSQQTVRRLVIAGDIDGYKLGGGTRIRRPSLAAYVARCRATPLKLMPPAAPGTRPKGRPTKAQLESADSAEG